MLPRRIEVILILLAIAAILALRWQSITTATRTNLAYISLARSIETADPASSARFTTWAAQTKSSPRERDASAYGLAILLSHTSGVLSARWLQVWKTVGCHLTTVAGRNQMIEWQVTASVAPQALLAMTNCLDNPTSAQWLLSAAEKKPQDVQVFVEEIENRGLVSELSQADRIRMAALYGDFARQKYLSGSSTGEVLVLVNKALLMDPQSETALIVKAIKLSDTGQLLEGIALLEQISVLYPNSYFLWESLATLRMSNLDYQGAESAARTSVGLQPL
jgi:hypothetical protein